MRAQPGDGTREAAVEPSSWMLAAAIALLWLGTTALLPVLPLSLAAAAPLP